MILPERIQLEVVFGCNASCTMCPVDLPTERKKGVMSMELFRYIVDEMSVYSSDIEKFDLWGLGEPLLDKTLFEKIVYAKSKGFRNLAIATNADLMDEAKQYSLLETGLDTIIFSIDGCRKETHEKIRKGVDFKNVIENARGIVEKRNRRDSKMRFVFRFIRQESNKNEWDSFKKYWDDIISPERNDVIIGYDVHSWGGEKPLSGRGAEKRDIETLEKACHHVFDRLIILWDGTVPLCCSDLHHGRYAIGNINDSSPIDIFNNAKINKIREIHTAGEKNSMKICRDCSILQSELTQELIA